MGFDWASIENSFPAFREDDPPQVTARKLHDYLYGMVSQLMYTLQNLDTENWNDAALDAFSKETVKGVTEDIRKLGSQITQINATLGALSGRLSTAEHDVTALETEYSYLEERVGTTEEGLRAVEEVAGQNQADIQALQEATEGIEQMRAAIEQNQSDIETLENKTKGLDQMTQDLNALKGTVQCGTEQTIVGEEGKPLHLWGEIYINGVLYDGGGNA